MATYLRLTLLTLSPKKTDNQPKRLAAWAGFLEESLWAPRPICLLWVFPVLGTANVFTAFPQSLGRRIEADPRETPPWPWADAGLVSQVLSLLLGQLFTSLKRQPRFGAPLAAFLKASAGRGPVGVAHTQRGSSPFRAPIFGCPAECFAVPPS